MAPTISVPVRPKIPFAVPLMFGRPNITGKFRFENGYGSADTCGNAIEVEGAFFNSDPVDKKIFQANENWRPSNKLNFSAASSNAIYTESTVQPASLRLMPCIRT